MGVTFTSTTKPECQDYMKIIYDNTEYSLVDFALKYKTEDFSLDKKLKESIIVYRGKQMTYKELGKANYDFAEELKFSEKYSKEICPIEHLLLISNRNYLQSCKIC